MRGSIGADRLKLSLSVFIVISVLILTPLMGLTIAEKDEVEGVVIDFGYWDTVWTEMVFTEGMDGYDALEVACHMNDFSVGYADDERREVFAVNGQMNLVGMVWRMYILADDGGWEPVEDPSTIRPVDLNLICWARSNDVEMMIPGTDASGFTYYSYATDGLSNKSGNKLRVVSLAPSITETLAAVGGVEYIVGTDLYSNYPNEIRKGHDDGSISVIGGYTDPNYEWILRLAPDIVFCEGGTGEHEVMADRLRKSGIDCVVLHGSTTLESLYVNIWVTAAALGLEKNANTAISYSKATLENFSGIVGNQGDKRVFFALSPDPSPWTSGSGTFLADLIQMASGRNIFAENASWFMVSKEQIHLKQPEVMIIISDAYIDTFEKYESLLNRLDPLWKETPAFRNGDVYVFSGSAGDILSRPGPRLTEAAELLCKIVTPQYFTDRDIMDVVPKYIGNDYADYLKYQEVKR